MEKTNNQWNLVVLLTQTAATLAGPGADFSNAKLIEAHVSNALKVVNEAQRIAKKHAVPEGKV